MPIKIAYLQNLPRETARCA